MLNLREGLFSTGHTADSTFRGIKLGTHNENDGCYFSRKVMIMNVVTNPGPDETIVVGGKTYTFKVSPVASTHIKIGNLVTDGNFLNANAANVWYGKHWTIDATGALHVAAVASGSFSAFADYSATIGGAVLCTDASHGLLTGDEVTIAGTTNYNGTYQIVRVDGNTFYVFPQNGWKGDDATGTWSTTSYIQPLVQEWVPTPIVGRTYTIIFTYSGRSAGSIVASIGGTAGSTRTIDGTYTETVIAVDTSALKFTPSTDFNGKITSITVTDSPATDLKAQVAKAIMDRINLDTATTLCTAYIGLEHLGLTTNILVVANTTGVTPTFTADGVKVVASVAFGYTLTEAQLETVAYFKKDTTAEVDVKPTVLVERNSGTDKNFLY